MLRRALRVRYASCPAPVLRKKRRPQLAITLMNSFAAMIRSRRSCPMVLFSVGMGSPCRAMPGRWSEALLGVKSEWWLALTESKLYSFPYVGKFEISCRPRQYTLTKIKKVIGVLSCSWMKLLRRNMRNLFDL